MFIVPAKWALNPPILQLRRAWDWQGKPCLGPCLPGSELPLGMELGNAASFSFNLPVFIYSVSLYHGPLGIWVPWKQSCTLGFKRDKELIVKSPHNNDKSSSNSPTRPWPPFCSLLWGLGTLGTRQVTSHHGRALHAGKSSPIFEAALERASHPHWPSR